MSEQVGITMRTVDVSPTGPPSSWLVIGMISTHLCKSCPVLFLTSNFEIINRKLQKLYIESLVGFPQLSPMVTSYITAVQCQTQGTDIGIILLTRLQTLFSSHHFLMMRTE